VKKYRLLLTIGFQDALQYRIEGIIWFLYDMLPTFMMVFLWLAAYRDTDEVAGYSLGAMLTYYLGLALLRNVVTTHPEWDIAESIRIGKLSTLLLKPLNPWLYWLAADAAWRLVRLFMVAPVLLVGITLLGGQVQVPRLTLEMVLALALCLPLGFALCYLLKICVGFVAFWLLEIGGLAGLYEVMAYLFGGTIVPLELLPAPLQAVANFLPWPWRLGASRARKSGPAWLCKPVGPSSRLA
jgi:ABC-2 type transport system permease protein